ncbi:hypothetical protein QTP88_002872 [Uroleucon formosanum]
MEEPSYSVCKETKTTKWFRRKDCKVYYMTEHMQFILPYIKGVRSVDSTGNLPSPPNVMDDEVNETDEVENTEENEFESTAESFNMTKSSNEQVFTPKVKKKKTNTSDAADQCFIDYINTKKQNSKKEDDPRKQFLLSMLPEIHQMTDIQMRKFKRKISVLTSPMYIQNSNNLEHTQTLQEYQSVLNLSNIEQVQINPNTSCIPLDMQEYLTKK